MSRFRISNRFLGRTLPVQECLKALYCLLKSIENTVLFYFTRLNLFADVRYRFTELKYRSADSEYFFRVADRGQMSPDTLNSALGKLFRDENLELPQFTVHDLSRTCRTQLGQLDLPGHIAERCMNHRLPAMWRSYSTHDYLGERRGTLDKVASRLTDIVNAL